MSESINFQLSPEIDDECNQYNQYSNVLKSNSIHAHRNTKQKNHFFVNKNKEILDSISINIS